MILYWFIQKNVFCKMHIKYADIRVIRLNTKRIAKNRLATWKNYQGRCFCKLIARYASIFRSNVWLIVVFLLHAMQRIAFKINIASNCALVIFSRASFVNWRKRNCILPVIQSSQDVCGLIFYRLSKNK